MFYHMTGACWARVSPLARDLVSKLLDIDQEKRLTVERAKVIMGLKNIIDSVVDSLEQRETVDGGDEHGEKRGEKISEKRKGGFDD